MDFFEEFKNLYTKAERIDSNSSFKNGYILNRFISFDPGHFFVATEATALMGRLPGWAVGCLMSSSISHQKVPYIHYPKIKKQEDEKILKMIQKYFNCNLIYAKQILKICVLYKIDLYKKFGVLKNENKKKM